MGPPLVSVIMPLYNARPYVGEAIKGLLAQTHERFELIIVDDGSTDGSDQVVNEFKDPRIRYHRQANTGVAGALNAALDLVNGSLIARHDADDVSLPERLESQVRHFQEHRDHVLLGAWAKVVDVRGAVTGVLHHPEDDLRIRFQLLFNSPFVSSSVMFRAEALKMVGGFDPSSRVFDDLDMWSRLSTTGMVANLPVELVKYRVVGSGLTHTTSNSDQRLMEHRRRRLASEGIMPESGAFRLLCELGMEHPPCTASQLIAMRNALYSWIDHTTNDRAVRAELRSRTRTLMESYHLVPHRTFIHRALDKVIKRGILSLTA